MATTEETTRELTRLTTNLSAVNEALRKERQERAEDNRKSAARISELEVERDEATKVGSEQVEAVATGVAAASEVNSEAEALLRGDDQAVTERSTDS